MFRESFLDEKISFRNDRWDNIHRKVRIRRFFSSDLKRFNYIYSLIIAGTFVFSVIDFIKPDQNNIETKTHIQNIEIKDTVNIRTVYIHDTVVTYIRLDTAYEEITIDTSAIIREYLNTIQALNELDEGTEPVQNIVKDTTERGKNLQIIYHTFETKDTFIKYMEKPEETDNTSLFKRRRK